MEDPNKIVKWSNVYSLDIIWLILPQTIKIDWFWKIRKNTGPI